MNKEYERQIAAQKILAAIAEPKYKHAFRIDGKQYITEGHIMAELTNPIKGIPEVTEPKLPLGAFFKGRDGKDAKPLDVCSIFDIADTARRENWPKWKRNAFVDIGTPAVDVLLLEMLIKAMGGDDFKIEVPKNNRCMTTIYSSNGKGVITPAPRTENIVVPI